MGRSTSHRQSGTKTHASNPNRGRQPAPTIIENNTDTEIRIYPITPRGQRSRRPHIVKPDRTEKIAARIGGGAGELNVNSITAGQVNITGQTISHTTNQEINITAQVNYTGGVSGSPVALNMFINA